MKARQKHRFIVSEKASKAASLCFRITKNNRKLPGDLGSQINRAAISVVMNIAEGNGRSGKDRAYHFRVAYSSALEASAGLQLLSECGLADTEQISTAIDLLDQVRAMVWRLMSG
jgi:four helix bundle protein